jgi:hypothetical protein
MRQFDGAANNLSGFEAAASRRNGNGFAAAGFTTMPNASLVKMPRYASYGFTSPRGKKRNSKSLIKQTLISN